MIANLNTRLKKMHPRKRRGFIESFYINIMNEPIYRSDLPLEAWLEAVKILKLGDGHFAHQSEKLTYAIMGAHTYASKKIPEAWKKFKDYAKY